MDNHHHEVDLEQLDSELKFFTFKWTKGENEGNVCAYENLFRDPTSGIIWVNFKDGTRINYLLLDEFMLRIESYQSLPQKQIAPPSYKNVMLSEDINSISHQELSPIISLLEKQKPNWIEVGIKLKLNLPTKSLYGVLKTSFDHAEQEIIEFVVKDLDIELVKQSLRNQIKEIYKGNGTTRKSEGSVFTHEEEY